MRRRRRVFLGVFGLAVLVAWLVAFALWPAGPIPRANCDRIADGTREAEVEALLGGPAHESEPIVRIDPGTDEPVAGGLAVRRWMGGGATITLVAHADGTVSGATFYPGRWWG